jgi:hypothetical protein
LLDKAFDWSCWSLSKYQSYNTNWRRTKIFWKERNYIFILWLCPSSTTEANCRVWDKAECSVKNKRNRYSVFLFQLAWHHNRWHDITTVGMTSQQMAWHHNRWHDKPEANSLPCKHRVIQPFNKTYGSDNVIGVLPTHHHRN